MKTKIILSVLILFAIAFTLTPNPCLSAVPSLINYQGVLKDSTGVPIDGDVIMVFSIWDDSTNGSKLWEELQSIVHVNHGLFNVLLGGSTPIPSAVFDGVARYLQVQVNTSVLQPRRRIVSVGYAYKASEVDTAEYARTDNDWVINGDNIYRVQGLIGIGTTNPQALLHVRVSGTTLTGDATPSNEGPCFQNSASGNNAAIDLIGPNDGGSVISFGDTDDRDVAGIFYSHVDNSMRFQTGDVYHMRITNNGNVGIGTESPAYKLDVEGDVQAYAYHTGDIIFQKDKQKLWRMFEDEEGLYLENLKTGKVYRFVLQEVEKK